MNHRTGTAVSAGLLALALGVLGVTLPVPLVALGPGPTFNTLDSVDGAPVVAVDGLPTYPITGHLNLTTVSVTDSITLVSALGYWASSRYQVVPRDTVFPAGRSAAETQKQNADDFDGSEVNAESAATRELALPSAPAVTGVVPGSAADGVLRVGDRLMALSGRPLPDPASVNAALVGSRPDQVVRVDIRRGAKAMSLDVKLGVAPQPDRGMLGVTLGVLPTDAEFRISLSGVGGPSAGLMFALGLVDKLTPGPLTGGRFVAGTGEITADGTVTKIGGIRFKMAAARDAGATIFLVPDGDCTEAVAAAPPGLQLVRVGTLHDAVVELGRIDHGQAPTGC